MTRITRCGLPRSDKRRRYGWTRSPRMVGPRPVLGAARSVASASRAVHARSIRVTTASARVAPALAFGCNVQICSNVPLCTDRDDDSAARRHTRSSLAASLSRPCLLGAARRSSSQNRLRVELDQSPSRDRRFHLPRLPPAPVVLLLPTGACSRAPARGRRLAVLHDPERAVVHLARAPRLSASTAPHRPAPPRPRTCACLAPVAAEQIAAVRSLVSRHARSTAPTAFSAAATIRADSASISASVRVFSRGWR